MTNNVQLCEALNEIVVDNTDCFNWEDFKDDIADKIGLSEDNFLYKLWDPIGMGDGKGFIDIG